MPIADAAIESFQINSDGYRIAYHEREGKFGQAFILPFELSPWDIPMPDSARVRSSSEKFGLLPPSIVYDQFSETLSLQDKQVIERLLAREIGMSVRNGYWDRMRQLASEEGVSLSQLVSTIRNGTSAHLAERLIQTALANVNLTSFFRYPDRFELFRDRLIPELAERRKGGRIRIWSVVCATGEEPYSLAMMIAHFLPDLAHRVEIVASDASRDALRDVKAGVYREIPKNWNAPWIDYFTEKGPSAFQVSDAIKRMVRFEHLNLRDPWPVDGGFREPFDIVLPWNILYHLTEDVRLAVVEKIHQRLLPDGYLILGKPYSVLLQGEQWLFHRRSTGSINPVHSSKQPDKDYAARSSSSGRLWGIEEYPLLRISFSTRGSSP